MATDALNPTVPVGGNQVEIAAELRGIKLRLVTDKASIETLQSQIAPITGAGTVGLQLLDSETTDAALAALAVTTVGKQLFHIADIPDAQALLGITSQIETITQSSPTPDHTTIVFGGGLMINIITKSISTGVEHHTWLTPFPNQVFGAVATINDNGTEAAFLQAVGLVDCYSDHSNSGNKNACIIAIGR
jgi:hypothetical protein